jgi:glycosyltransferase involved in cell wall biosynthesis
VDAIVTTGPPHSTHLIGLGLKAKTEIPWLADFRDPWTNIDYYQELKLGKKADQKHHQLEKKVLEKADAVTVISPGMEKEFRSIVKRDYAVIPNGFDAEDLPPVSNETQKGNKFSLAHIGSLTKTRNPDNLWEALKQLLSENENFAADLEIRNIGKMDFSAVESLQEYGLESFVKRIDYLPHNEVITEQRNASLLLLLINNTPNAKLILTGKIFEYLASGRPVLCIGPVDGDAAAVIRESECGSVYGFGEIDQLKRDLQVYYKRFVKGELSGDCKNVAQFDRKNLTERMANLLDSIT